jgi:hypothetical protein
LVTTGSTNAVVLADANQMVHIAIATANTVTLPSNASAAITIGSTVTILNAGVGKVTIAGDGTSTVTGPSVGLSLNQWTGATAVKVSTNGWEIFGSTVA